MTGPSNIYQALSKVMESVQSISKDGRNAQQNFSFRGIDAVMNAVGPALREQGVIVVPDLREYLYGTVEVGKARTPMSHARVTVAYTFHAPDGSSLTAVAPGEAMDSGDKATPKAMSVAFRTALLQALCVPTDDPEPDAHVYERSSAPELATSEVRDAIRHLGGQRGVADLRGFVRDTVRREVMALTDLTADEGAAVMARLIGMTDFAPETADPVAEQQAEIRQLRDELHEARGDGPQPEPVHRPAPPLEKISHAQKGMVMALFTRLQILDRDERLEYCGVIIGRKITTTGDMTKREASKLIDHLNGIESPVDAAGVMAPEGAIEAAVVEDPA